MGGELSASTGDSVGFGASSWSLDFEGGRESSRDEREAGERSAESGLCCWVRREEAFLGRANDYSTGLGSRAKLHRFGWAGGCCWLLAEAFWGERAFAGGPGSLTRWSCLG